MKAGSGRKVPLSRVSFKDLGISFLQDAIFFYTARRGSPKILQPSKITPESGK